MRTGYDLDIFDRGEREVGRLVELVNNFHWDGSEAKGDEFVLSEKKSCLRLLALRELPQTSS